MSTCVSAPYSGVLPHKPNETFSCEDGEEHATRSAPGEVNLTRVFNGPTLVTVPVVDHFLSLSARKLPQSGVFIRKPPVVDPFLSPSARKLPQSGVFIRKASKSPAGASGSLQPELRVNSNSVQPTQQSSAAPPVYATHKLEVQGSSKSVCHSDNAPERKGAADTGAGSGSGACCKSLNRCDKENGGPPKYGSRVKRAINFDGAADSPLRGNGCVWSR